MDKLRIDELQRFADRDRFDPSGPSWMPGGETNLDKVAVNTDIGDLADALPPLERIRRTLNFVLPNGNPLKFVTLSRQQAEILLQTLTFDTYQQEASKSSRYPGRGNIAGLKYLVLKLICEAAEAGQKVAKCLRDSNGVLDETRRAALVAEVGDTLWYASAIAGELGVSFSEIARANLDKLRDRVARGVLGGDGDNR
jgi:hypothetical protein